jgi:hypothetical protein
MRPQAVLQAFRTLKNVERLRMYFTQQDANHLMVLAFFGKHGERAAT